MICPKCNHIQADGWMECLVCGVIFAKMRNQHSPGTVTLEALEVVEPDEEPRITLKTLLFPQSKSPNELIFTGKALLLIFLIIWSFKFIFASIESNVVGNSFLHLVNLPFHEAGHIIFGPLGRFVQVLGGTLGQLLMPTICFCVLLIRTRDAFGAAVALWWLAESFMDIAPYINDARALNLVLLGGVTGKDVADYHDWEYILGHLGLLKMDHALAYLAQGTGVVLMMIALGWAVAHLWIEFKYLISNKPFDSDGLDDLHR